MALPKWNEERETALTEFVGSDTPVSNDTVNAAAEQLETTTRSVASKLRKMGFDVAPSSAAKTKAFNDEQTAALATFMEANAGNLTYADVAENFADAIFSAKQVQGKILSMELTGLVKPSPKKESVKTYTDAEEATFIKLANEGASLETIADALGRELASVRGKGLSLMRSEAIASIPKQENVKGKVMADPVADIDNIAELTVEAIAGLLDKSERGVKTLLTRRGISCADYDGAGRRAKADAADSDE